MRGTSFCATFTITGLLVASFAAPAHSAVNVFTNRASWLANLPAGAPFSEDFSSFVFDTVYHTVPLALNGGTISREGPQVGLEFISVVPHAFASGSATNHAVMILNTFETFEGRNYGNNVRFTFDQPNIAFGFNYYVLSGSEGARLDILNGSTLLASPVLPRGTNRFVGYILSGGDTATSVLLRANLQVPGGPGQAFSIDDLAGVAVPEPSTAALVLLATLGRRRCRMQRKRLTRPTVV
jgi:hypothetical protein